jgi:hypothetical protein
MVNAQNIKSLDDALLHNELENAEDRLLNGPTDEDYKKLQQEIIRICFMELIARNQL